MSTVDRDPAHPGPADPADRGPAPSAGAPDTATTHRLLHLNFWLRELPFTLVLILTVIGVGYTSFSKQAITGYWEILAPLIAIVCVGAGWEGAADNSAKFRLIATQLLHWFAFLLVMNMLLLPSVQRIFSAQAAGVAIFTLLTLGTFTAGVQVLSWQVCLLGLIMALGIPAIAWIENSALLIVLIVGALLAIGFVLWWHFRGRPVR